MKSKIKRNPILKGLFIALGFISLGLGSIGVLMPVLPTTPFVLLSAFLFARSSDKFYKWLLTNKLFGRLLRNYLENKGIPMAAKVRAIILIWVGISISAYIVDLILVRIMLFVMAALVTIHLLMIKTFEEGRAEKKAAK